MTICNLVPIRWELLNNIYANFRLQRANEWSYGLKNSLKILNGKLISEYKFSYTPRGSMRGVLVNRKGY